MSKHTTQSGARQASVGRKDAFRDQQKHHPSRLEPQKQKGQQKNEKQKRGA